MGCSGNALSRRSFLTVGAIGGLGLNLATFLEMRAAQGGEGRSGPAPAADSVLHIFLPGGIAHQETFDPKPYSPIEFRGEFGTVRTNTGEVICDTLPQLATIADKYALVRNMSHAEAAHERGTHNMFTGYAPSPSLLYPSMGSVVSHEQGLCSAGPVRQRPGDEHVLRAGLQHGQFAGGAERVCDRAGE